MRRRCGKGRDKLYAVPFTSGQKPGKTGASRAAASSKDDNNTADISFYSIFNAVKTAVEVVVVIK